MKETGAIGFTLSQPSDARYMTIARQVLGRAKSWSKGPYIKNRRTLLDGTIIDVTSNNGQDRISITTIPAIEEEALEVGTDSGALWVWPSWEGAPYGMGEPFDTYLGTTLTSADVNKKPYTKLHTDNGDIKADRDVVMKGGEYFWQGGNHRLAWDKAGGDRLKMWYNGRDILNGMYLFYDYEDLNFQVSETAPTSSYPHKNVAYVRSACMFYVNQDLWIRICTGDGVNTCEAPCTVNLTEAENSFLTVDWTNSVVRSWTSTGVWNSQGTKATSSKWLYAFNLPPSGGSDVIVETANGGSLGEEVVHESYHTHVTTSSPSTYKHVSTFPVGSHWVGDNLAVAWIAVTHEGGQEGGIETLGYGSKVTSEFLSYYRVNCEDRYDEVVKQQEMAAGYKVETSQYRETIKASVWVNVGGESAFGENHTLFEEIQAYNEYSWTPDWKVYRQEPHNVCICTPNLVCNDDGTMKYDPLNYRSIAESFHAVEIDWTLPATAQQLFYYFTIDQLPTAVPEDYPWDELPSSTNTHTVSGKSVYYNGWDFNPQDGYLMKLTSFEVPAVSPFDPVESDVRQNHWVTYYDLVTNRDELHDMENSPLPWAYNPNVVCNSWTVKPYYTDNYDDVANEKANLYAAQEVWGFNNQTSPDLIQGRNRKEGVGIMCARSKDYTSAVVNHHMHSFEFDAKPTLGFGNHSQATIHSVDIPDEFKIKYS